MHSRKLFLILGLFGVGSVAIAITACSSTPAATSNEGGSASNNCVDPSALTLSFNPMYSAFEPSHMYALPVIVNTTGNVTFTADPSDAVGIQPNPDLTVNGYTAATLTVLKAPSSAVTITAASNGACGSAQLFITAATADDWQVGNLRYNDGVTVHFPMFGGADGGMGGPPPMMQFDGSPLESEGGTACNNCHGPQAMSSIFKTVSHTPQQTGGFSDQEMLNIILHGDVPDSGYFDRNIVMLSLWQMLHQWSDISTPDLQKGIVVYLRSLTPSAQTGAPNLGGIRGPQDAGATD